MQESNGPSRFEAIVEHFRDSRLVLNEEKSQDMGDRGWLHFDFHGAVGVIPTLSISFEPRTGGGHQYDVDELYTGLGLASWGYSLEDALRDLKMSLDEAAYLSTKASELL